MLAWCWFGLAVARLAYQIYRDNKTKQKILSLRLADLVQRRAHGRHQRGGLGRGLHAVGGAQEQLVAQQLAQPPQRVADPRLRNAQVLRHRRHPAVLALAGLPASVRAGAAVAAVAPKAIWPAASSWLVRGPLCEFRYSTSRPPSPK